MKEYLIVAESFYSIQGEGKTSGVPAVFLRLAGCNLLCNGKGWVCDTIEVWQKGHKHLFNAVLTDEYVKRLKNGAHLIITGGEPLLQQEKILSYLLWFLNEYKFLPTVEIETNGTIIPKPNLAAYISYWNVSFKLSSSGESYERRINEIALKIFSTLRGATFKIVISSPGDILELVTDFGAIIEGCMQRLYLMPAGDTQEKLQAIRTMVAEQARELGCRYCDRLHILLWNQKTGV
jgi:organic radical activating enzyme